MAFQGLSPVNAWKQSGRVSLWRYTENERNYPGWGSTPLTRTLQLSPMMGQEECHAAEKALQRGVQA